MATLTIIRHGKSIWNKEKRFTGWTDVALSPHGVTEARQAGQLLREHGSHFDVCYTSFLSRASETLRLVLDTMNLSHLPTQKDWRLNERHYGALQGLQWWEATRKYGTKQVLMWQRNFDCPPPLLDMTDERFPGHDPLYSQLPIDELPRGESLKETIVRLLPLWYEEILPQLQQNKRVLIVAHHNSLRGLLKHIDRIPDLEISKVTIRTAAPIVIEFDTQISPISHVHLRPHSNLLQWAQKKIDWWINRTSK